MATDATCLVIIVVVFAVACAVLGLAANMHSSQISQDQGE